MLFIFILNYNLLFYSKLVKFNNINCVIGIKGVPLCNKGTTEVRGGWKERVDMVKYPV